MANASDRATTYAYALTPWATHQNTRGIAAREEALTAFNRYTHTYLLTDEEVQHIKQVQYDLMTYAINQANNQANK